MAQSQRKATAASTEKVREELARLQTAVRNMLAEVSQLEGSRPIQIAAVLGIDLKLAWKVSRIAQSGDPFSAVRHLPGAIGWRIATQAAGKAGASRAAVRASVAAFDQVLKAGSAWAGDRKALGIIAAGLATESDMRIDVEHRRQLYLGGSFVWGIRAELAMRIDILGPSQQKAKMLDCVTIRGFVGVERMRSGAAWLLQAPMVGLDHGAAPFAPTGRPLDDTGSTDPDHDTAGIHLLPAFCSESMPELRLSPEDHLPRALEVVDAELGKGSRFDIFHGSVLNGVQSVKRTKQHHGIFQVFAQRTPAQRAVFDLAVHRSVVMDGTRPECILYSDLSAFHPLSHRRAKDRIPTGIKVEELTGDLRSARLAGEPRHLELLTLGFDRMDWDPAEFALYRVEVPYPPVPSTVALECLLSE